MRIKKFVLGAILAVSVMGVGTVNASAKSNVTVINVNSKSQVKTATAKVWNLYQEDKLFKVQGKYKKNVSNNIDKKIVENTNLNALPSSWNGDAVSTGAYKKEFGWYKESLKYLSLICGEITEATEERLANPPAGASESQIKAEVLQEYMRAHCQYSSTDKTCQDSLKHLYEGNFKGVCQDGAYITRTVGQAMGYKMKVAKDWVHAWAIMKVKESDGTVYWQGIGATSCAFSLKKPSDVDNIKYKLNSNNAIDSETIENMTGNYVPSYKIPILR